MSRFSRSIGRLSEFQASTVQAGEKILSVDPAVIEIRPQVRKTFPPEYIQELAESIKARGQMQPAVVRPHPDPKSPFQYQMVAGECRHRACALNGNEIKVVSRDLTDDEVHWLQRAENTHRLALTQLEQAQAVAEDYERFKGNGGQTALAAQWNKTIGWVSQQLAFLEAATTEGSAAQRAIAEGVSKDVTTINALSRLEKIDAQKAHETVEHLKQSSESNAREVVATAIQKAKSGGTESPTDKKPTQMLNAKARTPQDKPLDSYVYDMLNDLSRAESVAACEAALAALPDPIKAALESNIGEWYESGKAAAREEVARMVIEKTCAGDFAPDGIAAVYQTAFLWGALSINQDNAAIVFAARAA